jgi:BirA family biotin operon repressor/biotin-[acetyl-CoA-carboxylase] ligase
MVNQKTRTGTSIKNQILKILRKEPEAFFGGESLASGLGVSRVAVWKAIKSLKAAGYPILSGEKGYCMKDESHNDLLYPWEFGERESFFHYFPTTDSTMNRAAELAAQSCPGGTVICAGEQSAGRGRNGRSWVSEKGGLFFTILERRNMYAVDYYRVFLAAQMAALKALRRICGKNVYLRWPNDIYAEGKKIAGLLMEFQAAGDKLSWISLGMGVNVNNKPGSKKFTNCSAMIGRPVSRQKLLLAILDEWELAKRDIESPQLHKEWNALSYGIGKNAAAKDGNEKLNNGIFLGIDEQGRLILEGEKTRFFRPGSVSIKFTGE